MNNCVTLLCCRLLRARHVPALLAFLMTATLMATLAAQCNPVAGYSIVPLLAPTTALAIDDEGRSADLALLGFTFPIGGSSYSHFVV